MAYRIFISSVQREFAKERKALASYIRKDAILGKFFEVFLFEEVPAQERKADGVYLAEMYRRHKSYPANPLLAYAMFLRKYVEQTGQARVRATSLPAAANGDFPIPNGRSRTAKTLS